MSWVAKNLLTKWGIGMKVEGSGDASGLECTNT